MCWGPVSSPITSPLNPLRGSLWRKRSHGHHQGGQAAHRNAHPTSPDPTHICSGLQMGGEPEEISMQGGGRIVCIVLHVVECFYRVVVGEERTIQGSNLALFLSLPHLQFLIAYSIQRGNAKPQAFSLCLCKLKAIKN